MISCDCDKPTLSDLWQAWPVMSITTSFIFCIVIARGTTNYDNIRPTLARSRTLRARFIPASNRRQFSLVIMGYCKKCDTGVNSDLSTWIRCLVLQEALTKQAYSDPTTEATTSLCVGCCLMSTAGMKVWLTSSFAPNLVIKKLALDCRLLS